MGDGFDTVCKHRMEDVNLKKTGKDIEKEVKDVKDFSQEPKDVLERNSGEPGEPERTHSIEGQIESNLAKMLATEQEVVTPFLYSDTKLRPEAPPFTPECISPNSESYGELETDNSCFVNVDLKLPSVYENQEKENFSEIELTSAIAIVKESKESNEEITEISRLKPFSIVSTPKLKQEIIREIEDPEIVAIQQSTSTTISETRESPVITERVRILSPAFFIGNKTQIIVLVASIVVCVILVIFVLV